jgi:hypothetical protein
MHQNFYILTLFLLSALGTAHGATPTETRAEAAYVKFQGDDRTDDMMAVSAITSGEFFGESGLGNLTQIQASSTFIRTNAPAQYDPTDVVAIERRGSIGFSQTFSQLTSLGLSVGFTNQTTSDSKNSLSRWYSLRLGHWWNKATLLTEIESLRTDNEQPSRSYLDTDSRRVLTPEKIQGSRHSLNLTWLATPQTMLMAGFSKILSENRPNALSATLEARYFIATTSTAVHLKSAAYEDTGTVGLATDYGRVSAREIEAQIHQHVSDKVIVALVSRDHLEDEVVRSMESDNLKRHSKMLQGRLRYRFVSGPVTDTVSELYFFMGQYNSLDAGTKINHAGLGGSYVL